MYFILPIKRIFYQSKIAHSPVTRAYRNILLHAIKVVTLDIQPGSLAINFINCEA